MGQRAHTDTGGAGSRIAFEIRGTAFAWVELILERKLTERLRVTTVRREHRGAFQSGALRARQCGNEEVFFETALGSVL